VTYWVIPGEERFAASQVMPAMLLKAPMWSAGRPVLASAARSERAAKRKNAPRSSRSAHATVS
jgi:hypothetical protein